MRFAFIEAEKATLAPWMLVSVREYKEQPAHLHAAARGQQRHEVLRPQRHQSLENLVQVLEACALRQLVERLEDGTFRR